MVAVGELSLDNSYTSRRCSHARLLKISTRKNMLPSLIMTITRLNRFLHQHSSLLNEANPVHIYT